MDTVTPLLSTHDAAGILRISTRRLVRLTRDGLVPHVFLPDGQIRYQAAAINQLIADCQVAPTGRHASPIPREKERGGQ